MNRLLLGFAVMVLSLVGSQVQAQLAVDGLHGVETQAAIEANPELAAQYGLSPTTGMACTGGGGTTNCGASQQNVADFQAAVNEQGTAPTTAAASGLYSVTLQEPLQGGQTTLTSFDGVDLISQYLSMIYMWAASIVGLIAVLMIVFSAIQIIFGGLPGDAVSAAKDRIFQALMSLVLLFCTALLLSTINPGFFF